MERKINWFDVTIQNASIQQQTANLLELESNPEGGGFSFSCISGNRIHRKAAHSIFASCPISRPSCRSPGASTSSCLTVRASFLPDARPSENSDCRQTHVDRRTWPGHLSYQRKFSSGQIAFDEPSPDDRRHGILCHTSRWPALLAGRSRRLRSRGCRCRRRQPVGHDW